MPLLLPLSSRLDSSLPAYWIVHTGQTSWQRMSSSTTCERKEEESRKKMIGSNHNSHLLHFLNFLVFSNLCIILIGVFLFSGEDKKQRVENYLKRTSVRLPNPAPVILMFLFLSCFYVLSMLLLLFGIVVKDKFSLNVFLKLSLCHVFFIVLCFPDFDSDITSWTYYFFFLNFNLCILYGLNLYKNHCCK